MPQQPHPNNNLQGRLLTETGPDATAAKNAWLASLLLRLARRLSDLQNRLLAWSSWLWVQSQTRLRAMRPNRRLINSTITGVALVLAAAAPALAGTITVNSLADDGSGGCTLREAIITANTNAAYSDCVLSGAPGDDTIDMTGLSGTITLVGNLPDITETVQFNGPTATALTIDGTNAFNAIYGTGAGTNISVDRLTVTNVISNGIHATDNITVTNSTISGGSCGIYAYNGAALVSNSTVTGLTCDGVNVYSGAVITGSTVTGDNIGVEVFSGPVTVSNSRVTGNYSGIRAFGDALVSSSVITGTAYDGVSSYANVTVISSTVTASYSGIFSYSGAAVVNNSVITGTVYNGLDASADATVISSTITAGNNGVYSDTGNVLINSSIINAGADDGIDANQGYAKVSNSRVTGGEAGIDTDTSYVSVSNSIITGAGTGIDAMTSATVISSTITGNNVDGVYARTDASVAYSTVTGGRDGVAATNDVSLQSSTVSGSSRHGVQSISHQDVTISHSTIVNNTGYGILNPGGNTVISHTIVANNSGLGTTRDLNTSLGANSRYNLIGNGNGTGLTNGVNGNLVGNTGSLLDAKLGPLQNNGGPTLTHLPNPASPAIDTGNPAFSTPPAFDQRGAGFPRVVDTLDIGAVEAVFKPRIRLPIIFKGGS